jgi:hypothetical protein
MFVKDSQIEILMENGLQLDDEDEIENKIHGF